MSGTYPVPPAWYNIIWVTIVLILFTIGEIWARLFMYKWSKGVAKGIKTGLQEAAPVGPFVYYFLTFCKSISILLLVMIWWLYAYWV